MTAQWWQLIAEERGWGYTPTRPPQLLAKVHGVEVLIEHVAADEADPRLRLCAPVAAPADFTFKVERGRPSFLEKIAGPPLRLGKAFDDAFVVDTSDDDLMRAWFDHAVRRSFDFVAQHQLPFTLALRAGQLEATVRCLYGTGTELAALAELVAAVANGPRQIAQRWADLARELGGDRPSTRTFPPAPIELSRPHAVVRIEALRDRARWHTRLTFSAPLSDPTQAGHGALRTELPGILLDRATIERAIDAGARALIANPDGPYR